jgi:hypothetical protein
MVYTSYKLNLEKIVIAPWLLEKVQSVGEDAVYNLTGMNFIGSLTGKRITVFTTGLQFISRLRYSRVLV